MSGSNRYYRLWCGEKRYSNWIADEKTVWHLAVRHGLAFEDRNGVAGLGPLTWIEIGERARPKAKTIPIDRRG